jgi:peptide/nickel transport system permease protein
VASTVALRVTDVMLAFPSILLALFLVAVIGPSDYIVMLALTILYIPGFTRFARGMALSLRERAFVEASVISGGRSWYVIRRHLLPNAIGPLLVGVSLTAAYTLLAAATLSYLGLGTPPPAPSWGNMLQASFNYVFQDWQYGIWPGLCIVIVALGYVLVAEGIEVAVQRSGSAGADAVVDTPGATPRPSGSTAA